MSMNVTLMLVSKLSNKDTKKPNELCTENLYKVDIINYH